MNTNSLLGIHESLWLATSLLPEFPKLEGGRDVDVAIVGGGITGITAALLLQRAGKRVALLEARRLAHGVSGSTTAHLTEALDTRYFRLADDFGVDGARLAAQASGAALEQIAQLVDELAIECGFRRVPGFLFCEGEKDLASLHREFEVAKRLGLAVTMTDDVPLPFPTRAAVRFEQQAEFHVGDYLAALVGAFERGGGLVFEHTPVVAIEEGSPCRVRSEGGTVTAAHVLEATNVPLNRVLLHTKISHYRSYAVALRVAQPRLGGLFWDTADPYHYLRSADAPSDDRGLLIVGGEDHKTGTESDTDIHFENLLAYADTRFSIEEIGFRWSSQVIETADGLPYIGRNPKAEAVFVATGYSGNGMTFGTVAAILVRDLVLGRENPWAKLLDPARIKPLAAAKDFLVDNAEVGLHFVADRLRPPDAKDLGEVGPGEGKIVRVDGKRLAVYRDERGAIHAVSPVCTHLGCHVKFNHAEKSWDCPCHGSRFDVDGGVLDGPAVRGLAVQAVEDARAPKS